MRVEKWRYLDNRLPADSLAVFIRTLLSNWTGQILSHGVFYLPP